MSTSQFPVDHKTLFNQRLIERLLRDDPIPESDKDALLRWTTAVRAGDLSRRSERQLRGAFINWFFVDLLGYKPVGSGAEYTIAEEARAGTGSADVALGVFGARRNDVIAPVELKGPDTKNLDVIMPGRHKSPVQQVWEYGMDIPGSKFLILSNMLEVRLYAVGHTRRVFERFDLAAAGESHAEYHRLKLLLAAENLLGGQTARLLAESAVAEREISRQLYADYKKWRIQLIIALAHANDLPPSALIAPAQKLLDRVLFIAFAQQRGLLPANTLQEVHQSSNAWNPTPKFDNYRGLFRAIDEGLPSRQIPPYNGGLFAFDAKVDNLHVPDAATDVFFELAKYDYGKDVSVYVLGHIFEQSISDLEELQELANAGEFSLASAKAQAAASSSGVSGARKDQGIVYTPEYITTFIVDRTLGRTIEERRQNCLQSFLANRAPLAGDSVQWRKPLPAEKKYAASNLRQKERVVELSFWRAWLHELTDIKVCDPACGSGAFLGAAFDLLLAEYNNVNEQIAAITGSMEVFNADKEILNSNLFGVDLNAESIEITKLSLWLKTARYAKPLESLEANLLVGNSLISSADGGAQFDPKAFDWKAAFFSITERGGFDVVIGNPPYVRMERLRSVKPYLESRYTVASERADLYCYFFELAVRLLRSAPKAGRLGFISSGTFFRTENGRNLREYLIAHTQIEIAVDFGDLQVFEGVTTYPAIIIASRSDAPDANGRVQFLNASELDASAVSKSFPALAESMPQSRLTANSWRFESDLAAALHVKLVAGRSSLREIHGAPLYGIKTGLNEAFVVNGDLRSALLARDPRSAELLRPFLEGKDLRRWKADSRDQWLIYIPKNRVNIDDFPAIRDHLLPFKSKLEKRATQQAWYELQQSQEAYAPQMRQPKVIYTRFMDASTFWYDSDGQYYINNALSFIRGAGYYEAGFLNSKLVWYVLRTSGSLMSGGFIQVHGHVLEKCPMPSPDSSQKEQIACWAQEAQAAAAASRDEVRKFGHLVLRDLVPTGTGGPKLGEILTSSIPEFSVFIGELKKRFKRELSLSERNDWESALVDARQRVAEYEARIRNCERQIDAMVYDLFDLTANEIALIET